MGKTTLLFLLACYYSLDTYNGLSINRISSFRRSALLERPLLMRLRTSSLSATEDDSIASGNNNQTSNQTTSMLREQIYGLKPKVKKLAPKINDWGMSLQPKAVKVQEKKKLSSSNATDTKPLKQVGYSIQSCVMYAMFILYRSFRGLFVLLPAVFQQVYQKLEVAVDSPFSDEPQDLNPDTGRTRLRTTIVVSLVSSIVTLSYMLNGALRVAKKFFKTVRKTKSPFSSLVAAGDEFQVNEEKFVQYSEKDGGIINGGSS